VSNPKIAARSTAKSCKNVGNKWPVMMEMFDVLNCPT
jgi:hypothetical protein